MTAPRIDGFDISHHQPWGMNFATAKASGVRFVYHKATEGTGFVDDYYTQRRAQAKTAGLLFGGYHFARTNDGTPEQQAAHFLAVAKPVAGDLWPTLDFETDDAGLTTAERGDWVQRWIAVVKPHTGGVVIYTPYDLPSTYDCPLWTASYSDSIHPPTVEKPWSRYSIWQFSDGVYPHGGPNTIPGVGHCDINTIAGGTPATFLDRITIGGITVPDIYTPKPYYGYKYSDGTAMKTCVRDAQALELLRKDLNDSGLSYPNPLFLYQGCYHDGSLSAATHMGSSVYDLHPSDFEKKAEFGARHGIIVFHRPPNWDGKGGGEHLHCIVRGGQKMNPAARAQVADWDQHLNGLADHAHYDGPWFPVKPFVYHAPRPPKDPPPVKPPPPAKPPHDWPILDAPREAIGDAIRAMDAVTAAHPKWAFGSDMQARWQADWKQLHDIQNPDK